MRLTFLLDVDNTLLDNDALKAACDHRIRDAMGAEGAARFWDVYEAVRTERGVIDYPATFARFRAEVREQSRLAEVERAIYDEPFPHFVYPGALDVIEHLWTLGAVTILSDGDQVYQPLKIGRSGLAAAVRGNVIVYEHKEAHLEEIAARFGADHLVQVDDKAALLAVTKARLDGRVTTVHVRQGHYAGDPPDGAPPDVNLDRIAELATVPRERFLG